MPDHITCRDSTWLVSESRERQLSDAEQDRLKLHLSECEFCKGASQQFDVLFRQIEAYFGTGRSRSSSSKK